MAVRLSSDKEDIMVRADLHNRLVPLTQLTVSSMSRMQ